MEFRNLTPFPAIAFKSMDAQDREFHVAVLKTSYAIDLADSQRTGNAKLSLLEDDPVPLCMQDAYYEQPNTSSVLWESDLAPYKPKCDVIVANAHAHLPMHTAGGSLTRWRCGFSVHQGSQALIDKELIVCGERHWQRSVFWGLGNPKPTDKPIAIRYENAYGGRSYLEYPAKKEKPPLHEVNHANPLGKGWHHSEYFKQASPSQCPAAQIESPDAPVSRFDREYTPQGLGVIGRAWQPRLALAGTYDDAWLQERWPKLPHDFDFAYWNGAHPDLQIPLIQTPKANSDLLQFTLTHLLPSTQSDPRGQVKFSQPPHRSFMLARFESGEIAVLPTPLDTIVLDLAAMQLHCVYRAVAPVSSHIRAMEARLELAPKNALLRMAKPTTGVSV